VAWISGRRPEKQMRISALIVAVVTGCKAPGLKKPINHTKKDNKIRTHSETSHNFYADAPSATDGVKNWNEQIHLRLEPHRLGASKPRSANLFSREYLNQFKTGRM
jgi:hypothetical protein